MEIVFDSERLRNTGNDTKVAKRLLGAIGAKKLGVRLDDLSAAATLEALRRLPGHCHELKGALAGHCALDLDGGRRLVIRPNHNPVPTKDDGGLDWSRVTSVVVVNIGDYHD